MWNLDKFLDNVLAKKLCTKSLIFQPNPVGRYLFQVRYLYHCSVSTVDFEQVNAGSDTTNFEQKFAL